MALPDDGAPNSLDDRERLDIHTPRHRDGMREGLQAGGLVLILTLVAAIALGLTGWANVALIFFGCCLAVLAGRRMQKRIARANS